MNTVRAAAVTKSGNPLPRRGSCTLWVCDKSHVELTLRVMPPATDKAKQCFPHHDKKVVAK
jgi:hypothetical protein